MNSIYGNEVKDPLSGLFSAKKLQDQTFVLTGLRLAVRNVSLWKIGTPWQVPRRKINDTLIWLVREGSFTAAAGEKIYRLHGGEGVIIPEYTSHGFDFAPRCSAGKVFVIHADIFPSSGRSFAACLTTHLFKLQNPDHLYSLLERAIALRHVNRETAFLYARNPVQELLLECAEHNMFRTDIARVDDMRIRCAMDFFCDNYMNDIGVADAAAQAGLGEVQFRNLFKKHSGCAPAVYLKNLRLRHAAELLAGTPAAIKDIARNSGFNSESYFCLVFRKHYGVTPEEYRKNSFSL